MDAGVTNWESFIADLREFVKEKNISSFKVTEFSSKFDQLNFSGHNHMKFTRFYWINDLMHDLAFGKNIENLKQTVEIRHVGYGNYSWKINLSVEIDGRKYENVNLNTYETKQYFNNYQILGGFVNTVKIAYDAEPESKSIQDHDNQFESNITLKNLGFYWYVNQILDSFNKSDYNRLALDYINVRKGHNLDQIKATAVKRAERNSGGYFKVASEINSGYNLNDKVVDEYFYVSLQSEYAEGIFEMLVKNVNL
ncbi:hypothetical protein [Spiroplasma endosymbiont of Stenodema calcarata]|uniref:hypothetical protein n=1 Tax=Spiroplasma endosymbiont of Stenodema calcarata TaxID=3139328 RepID=UPI003CCA7BEC